MNEIKLIQGACSNAKRGEMECIKTNKTTSDRNRKGLSCRRNEITGHTRTDLRVQKLNKQKAPMVKQKCKNEIKLSNEGV